MDDIFSRLKRGEIISPDDPGYVLLNAEVAKSRNLVAQMNSCYRTQEELCSYLSEITGSDVDKSVNIFLPFYIAYG